METVKNEFGGKFVAKYRSTDMKDYEPQYKLPISSSAEEVWQFIEEKCVSKDMMIALLEGLEVKNIKEFLDKAIKSPNDIKIFGQMYVDIAKYRFANLQRTSTKLAQEVIELQKENAELKEKLKDERIKAIDECIGVAKDHEKHCLWDDCACDATIIYELQQLKEV